MKIVAGLGSIDDYIALCKAGADEVFCGFVPYEWNKKYKSLMPLNRREVLYYNVQINSISDMKILKKMVDKYKVPVVVTFNSLYYTKEQYKDILILINELINIGFNEFIIADIGLILELRQKKINCIIHLSGEACEINRLSMEIFNELNISRYIFHRKNLISDMKNCIESNKSLSLEYEAFILNEKCHYTGAYCNSLHSDEMVHLCKVPYKISKFHKSSKGFSDANNKLILLNDTYKDIEEYESEEYIVGESGCGLCFLMELKNAGITHLKVVGRGKYIDDMVKDIKILRKAIDLLSEGLSNSEYKYIIKSKFFKGKCRKKCYF